MDGQARLGVPLVVEIRTIGGTGSAVFRGEEPHELHSGALRARVGGEQVDGATPLLIDPGLIRHERDTLAAIAALDALRQQPGCGRTCRDELRLRVWPLLAKPLAKPIPRTRATPVGNAYLDALQREAKP